MMAFSKWERISIQRLIVLRTLTMRWQAVRIRKRCSLNIPNFWTLLTVVQRQKSQSITVGSTDWILNRQSLFRQPEIIWTSIERNITKCFLIRQQGQTPLFRISILPFPSTKRVWRTQELILPVSVQIWLLTSADLEVSAWNWKQTKGCVSSTTFIVWEKKALSILILRKQEKRDTISRIISALTQWNLKRIISRWETVMEESFFFVNMRPISRTVW